MSKSWRYISECDVSGSYGLAADELLMLKSTESKNKYQGSLRLYNYKNYSALCGRFQNILAEIDIEKCIERGYDFSRRMTGGGAIIMGKGQLGICLAISGDNLKYDSVRELYVQFSQPIINALDKIGIKAEFKSKNDLEVNGKKIAGLGVHVDVTGGIQFHTSLLVDLDVLEMLEVLNIPIQKFDDKRKIFSVNQRITTINKLSGKNYSIKEVKSLIKDAYVENMNIQFDNSSFSDDEQIEILNLERNRYSNKNWIFQHSPQEDMTGMSLRKTKGGLLRTYIGLKGNTIKSVLITGDFFEQNKLLRSIETKVKWSPLDREKVMEIINSEFVKHGAIFGISESEILEAIMDASRKAKTVLKYHYEGSCYYPDKKTIIQ